VKEVIIEFEKRLSVEVRRQEKLDMSEERNFRREELPEKYTVKMLYRWNNKKFKKKYSKKAGKELVKIEVSFFKGETLKEG